MMIIHAIIAPDHPLYLNVHAPLARYIKVKLEHLRDTRAGTLLKLGFASLVFTAEIVGNLWTVR